jgi:hypothetical protein
MNTVRFRAYSAWGKIICIIILVLSPADASGTSIIVIRSRRQLWLAADSKQIENTGKFARNVCKIIKQESFYWAASSPFYSDPYTGFEVEGLMKQIHADKGTLVSAMRAFIEGAKGPLVRELQSMKTDDPALYGKIVKHKQSPLEVVFVGLEESQPTIVWANFIATESRGAIVVSAIPNSPEEPSVERPFGFLGMGEFSEAERYIRANGSKLSTDTVGVIRNSMAAEEKVSKIVGSPFTIIRLDASGVAWVDRGKCE